MLNIEIEARGFSGSYVNCNGTTFTPISHFALLRSMITVGYKNETDLIGYGWRSIGWHISTCLLTLANTENKDGNLVVSKFFHSLDASEKTQLAIVLEWGSQNMLPK